MLQLTYSEIVAMNLIDDKAAVPECVDMCVSMCIYVMMCMYDDIDADADACMY